MRYPRLGQWLFCAALRHSVDGVYQYGLNCKSRRHENLRTRPWRSMALEISVDKNLCLPFLLL